MSIATTVITIPWPFALLGVFLIITAAVLWSKAQVKRRREHVSRTMESLGMKPVEASDPELQERFHRLKREAGCTPMIALAWKRNESFGDTPDFDQHYAVAGSDEPAIRQFLSSERLRELARLKDRHLEADGDMFMYSRSATNKETAAHEETAIYDLIEEVKLLYRVFA